MPYVQSPEVSMLTSTEVRKGSLLGHASSPIFHRLHEGLEVEQHGTGNYCAVQDDNDYRINGRPVVFGARDNYKSNDGGRTEQHGTNDYETNNSAHNLTGTHPTTIPCVTLMTPTHLTLALPLLSLLTAAPTLPHSLLTPLLSAHLRTNHVTLLPASDGSGTLHLAVNYHNAGKPPSSTALTGPAQPFVTCPLHPDVLKALRRFTLLVPTAEGWVGDEVMVRERQGAFLSAAAAATLGHLSGFDLLELQEAWFWGTVAAGAEVERRRRWVRAVGRSMRALGVAMAGALFADGEEAGGEEARAGMWGEVVFQEWCDGWGDGCGADVMVVNKVVGVVGELERCYGRRLRARLAVAEETRVGGWGEVGWTA